MDDADCVIVNVGIVYKVVHEILVNSRLSPQVGARLSLPSGLPASPPGELSRCPSAPSLGEQAEGLLEALKPCRSTDIMFFFVKQALQKLPVPNPT